MGPWLLKGDASWEIDGIVGKTAFGSPCSSFCSSKENNYQYRIHPEGEAPTKKSRNRNVLGTNAHEERYSGISQTQNCFLSTRGCEESKEGGVAAHKKAKVAVAASRQNGDDFATPAKSTSSSFSSSTRYGGIDYDQRMGMKLLLINMGSPNEDQWHEQKVVIPRIMETLDIPR